MVIKIHCKADADEQKTHAGTCETMNGEWNSAPHAGFHFNYFFHIRLIVVGGGGSATRNAFSRKPTKNPVQCETVSDAVCIIGKQID